MVRVSAAPPRTRWRPCRQCDAAGAGGDMTSQSQRATLMLSPVLKRTVPNATLPCILPLSPHMPLSQMMVSASTSSAGSSRPLSKHTFPGLDSFGIHQRVEPHVALAAKLIMLWRSMGGLQFVRRSDDVQGVHTVGDKSCGGQCKVGGSFKAAWTNPFDHAGARTRSLECRAL